MHSGVMDFGRLTALSLDVGRANGSLRRAASGHGVDGHDRSVLDKAATQLEDVATAIDGWANLRSSRIWRASTLGTIVGICADMDDGVQASTDVSRRMREIATQLRSDIEALDTATIEKVVDWISRLSAGIRASQSVVPCVTVQMGTD